MPPPASEKRDKKILVFQHSQECPLVLNISSFEVLGPHDSHSQPQRQSQRLKVCHCSAIFLSQEREWSKKNNKNKLCTWCGACIILTFPLPTTDAMPAVVATTTTCREARGGFYSRYPWPRLRRQSTQVRQSSLACVQHGMGGSGPYL